MGEERKASGTGNGGPLNWGGGLKRPPGGKGGEK